eukprot:7662177-Pyramimonas_sp.AAC.1
MSMANTRIWRRPGAHRHAADQRACPAKSSSANPYDEVAGKFGMARGSSMIDGRRTARPPPERGCLAAATAH